MAIELAQKEMLTPKVQLLKDTLLQTSPRLSTDRLRFLKEVYQETDGEPTVIRRAKLYDRFLRGMSLFIDENPVVGKLTQYRLGVIPFPEISCKWMKTENRFSSSLGEVEVSDEDRLLLREAADYWENRCIMARSKEVWYQKYGDLLDRDECVALGVWADQTATPRGRLSVDYGKVLTQGLEAIIEEAQAELAKRPLVFYEALNERSFLNAVVIACWAVIALANRYASLARDMAKKETDPGRKRELGKIAKTCERVPAKPARTFYEAVQSFWFTQLACLLERNGSGYAPGRFSQYMYPFYKKDRDEGRITEEEALELLELLFIKFTETGIQFESATRFQQAMGSKFQNLSIGGVTPDGKDATNDIDYLVLEAQKRVKLIQPTISLLYHDKMSQNFLLKAVEVVRTGIGMPAFFNSDLNVQALTTHGASLEDARNHCIVGCVERGFSHTANTAWGGSINIAKFLELALNNGKDPQTGKQLGPKTGDPKTFRTYDELHEAVKKQFQHFFTPFMEFQLTSNAIDSEAWPLPFASALVDDCISKGKDMGAGGSRYSMDGSAVVGTVDLADSLAAIKRLVFEEKQVTIGELLKALHANFEGYEEIYSLLLKAPKYGNDDDYVDRIVREWYDIHYQEHQQKPGKCHLGRRLIPNGISVTRHFPYGAAMGALPSGRKARLPLTDGSVSAMPGTDVNGPTALLNSASKAIDTSRYGCSLLNMKFHPTSLATEQGLRNMIALIKTYMDLGGHHIQFNVVSDKTLKDAQIHPDNYKHLIVRVAGFSAFFIHLDPVIQNEIIKRSELRF